MPRKTPTDAGKELSTVAENTLATRLVLLTLLTKTRSRATRLH